LAEGTEVRLTISHPPVGPAAAAEAERALRARVDRLAALEPNWEGYGAPALDRGIVDAARQFIGWLAGYATLQPQVVPMSSGALQLEWHQGQKILELEFEDSRTIHYLRWDPAAGIQEEDVFPLGDTAKAISLIDWFTGDVANA
jgi:hypothetical protein